MDDKLSIRIHRKKKQRKCNGIFIDTSKCLNIDQNVNTNEDENIDIKKMTVKIKKSDNGESKHHKSKIKIIT